MILDINKYISPRLKKHKVAFPKPEDKITINAFLRRHNINQSNALVYKNIEAFDVAYKKTDVVLPNAYFYNSEGDLIAVELNPDKIQYNIGKWLRNLIKQKVQTHKKISDILEFVEADIWPQPKVNEITIIITWAIYAGNINKDYSFKWIELFDKLKQSGYQINYYLLNCDLQKHWDYK
jgi:hypothetical protein